MQRKIGEVFTTKDGVTLKVAKEQPNIRRDAPKCFNCFYDMNRCIDKDKSETGNCAGRIFVEVEPEKEWP